jgi:hypothetical protein
MKKLLFVSSFLLTVFCHQTIAQCSAGELSSACTPKLAAQEFNFLKTYQINGGRDLTKVEYSYVFAKGTQYLITICDQKSTANTIMITIYDAKRNKVASNKFNGSLVSAIAYPCNATGIYYMQYTFEGSSSRCGGSALGFKR